jgi:hypothetical protein
MKDGAASCAGPCDPAALAKSYTGCVYYAVDLPQFGLQTPGGFGTIAAAVLPVVIADMATCFKLTFKR